MALTRGGPLAAFSTALVDLVAAVVPATVCVLGRGDEPGSESSGSGFVVDADGHVVTNHHVVDGLVDPLRAVLPGRHSLSATVVGVDRVSDLAVLRLSEAPSAHLTIRPEPARLGELCLALGSPFGRYPESVSLGVVSGLARTIPQRGTRDIERAIQTDAAINPGNSGGPLVDASGEVIGVNQCTDVRGHGIGFAIPADTVRRVVAEILEHGAVERAALGVGVALRQVELEGVEVPRLAVTKSRSADLGADGLWVGDVILTVDGVVVDERADLLDLLTRDRIGVPVPIEVLRDGVPHAVHVVPTKWVG